MKPADVICHPELGEPITRPVLTNKSPLEGRAHRADLYIQLTRQAQKNRQTGLPYRKRPSICSCFYSSHEEVLNGAWTRPLAIRTKWGHVRYGVISRHQKRGSGMSALPPKADIFTVEIDVRYVPSTDIGGGMVA